MLPAPSEFPAQYSWSSLQDHALLAVLPVAAGGQDVKDQCVSAVSATVYVNLNNQFCHWSTGPAQCPSNHCTYSSISCISFKFQHILVILLCADNLNIDGFLKLIFTTFLQGWKTFNSKICDTTFWDGSGDAITYYIYDNRTWIFNSAD
jgi:hypothetical protein